MTSLINDKINVCDLNSKGNLHSGVVADGEHRGVGLFSRNAGSYANNNHKKRKYTQFNTIKQI